MNHLRKKAAVQKHFSEPYQSLEEMKAGLKADESGYTEEEVDEIIRGIREKAKEASQPGNEGQEDNSTPATFTLPDLPQSISPEEMAEFNAWKEKQKGLKAETTADLSKAVAGASRYRDYDVFQGNVVKEKITNPYNPERPHVVIKHIELGKIARMTKIEPAMAHEFNELAIGQEPAMNHGDVSTSLFYFPLGEKKNGDQITITEFAAYQRQDIRYRSVYDPRSNMSLIIAAQQAVSNY